MKPGLRKYACKLTLDPDTAHRYLLLSDNNTKAKAFTPEKCKHCQVLCTDGVIGHCYWEIEWKRNVFIAVTYKTMRRRRNTEDSWFGRNSQSWSLQCSESGYSVWHKKTETELPFLIVPVSHRVAVYVNYSAGTISFYEVSNDELFPIHTFHSTFTEPLYPGFGFGYNSSVTICEL